MSEDEKQNSEANDRYMFEGFFIKEFLDSVKDGNLIKIKQEIEKHSLDVKYIKDSIHYHNALFYAALIKDDNV
jgi:hypothetical protein